MAELERQLGQNSGNAGKLPSRDSAAERQRQAAERDKRKAAGTKRAKGKQRGTKGSGLEMAANPDTVVDHRPVRCESRGAELGEDAASSCAARQVIDLPRIVLEVTEHWAHTCRCPCGRDTTAAFPATMRAPVSYGPGVRAVVGYLLGREDGESASLATDRRSGRLGFRRDWPASPLLVRSAARKVDRCY